ncbi:MAG: phosphoribosylanthranilate isomerase [Acidobacteria bacterium]|nr:phosphoribosylanthranilate isomerase [Acidobacteriota bacterium]
MARAKVKVCGITRRDDALRAADLGASAVGFVFWPRSPRYVEPETAAAFARELPADVAPVGVFVDPAVSDVRRIAELVGLAAVQLHGDEPATLCDGLPYRVLKAVAVAGETTTSDAAGRVPGHITVLLDARDPVRRGGTGRTVDWRVAAGVAARRRIFLAGGLAPENVGAALSTVRPYGIDVSSGVEEQPGRKDAGRLREFFEEVARA